MVITKKKSVANEEVYVDMTKCYISALKEVLTEEDYIKYNKSGYLLSECYRHSLCLALGLDTVTTTDLIRKYEFQISNRLKSICNKYNLYNRSNYDKLLVLQMCVHHIDIIRKWWNR